MWTDRGSLGSVRYRAKKSPAIAIIDRNIEYCRAVGHSTYPLRLCPGVRVHDRVLVEIDVRLRPFSVRIENERVSVDLEWNRGESTANIIMTIKPTDFQESTVRRSPGQN